MWDVDFTGIGVETVTLLAKTGLTVDDEGKVAKVSAEKEAGLCAAEDIFYGVISKVDLGGGVVALDKKGYKEVGCTGIITPGYKELVADAAGGVKEPGTQASLVTGVEADDNAILWKAREYGVIGHAIRIKLEDPSGANQALSIGVAGKDITVSLATDGASAITSTAFDIITAIAASADATSLVMAANSGISDGTGVVVAEALTALAGGADASVGKKYHVVSVDNAAATLVLDLG